jgi:hypothetical protein
VVAGNPNLHPVLSGFVADGQAVAAARGG